VKPTAEPVTIRTAFATKTVNAAVKATGATVETTTVEAAATTTVESTAAMHLCNGRCR
jgi:hypothetical protein